MTGPLTELLDGPADAVVAYAGDVQATLGELRRLADALADDLRAHGRDASAIGVLMGNEPATIAAWFGVWCAAGTFVPLNPRVPASERARAAAATGLRAVVTTAELAPEVGGDSHPVTGTPYSLALLAPDAPRAVGPEQAIVQFTSGTTGAPKAVVLRHDTIRALLGSVIGTLRGVEGRVGHEGRVGRPDRPAAMPNLVPMSLSLWAGIYQVLFARTLGVPVVLMAEFDTREFARLVAEYGIRSSVLPPAALVMLANDPAVATLAPLRYVRSVSAPLSPAHARHFRERFGVAILNGYGQTELGGEAIGWSAADWKAYGPAKLGAVGRPHGAFSVRVRADDGTIGGIDAVGELEIRSDAGLPRDLVTGGRITDDGWLRTGDIARVDSDGFVWIEGRVSAMINRGGLKVHPDEVEERIRSLAGVADVAVAGVPDVRLGEVPWAFVTGTTDLAAVQHWCRETLAAYKVPVGLTIVDALPRNEMGKVLRQDLVLLVPPT